MSKILRCREVGMDCDWEGRGESQQEVLTKAADHAKTEHGIEQIPADLMAKVQSAVHDE
ncbi:MAG: DUF1059 domain-containing protein [Acidobacteriota bacterium]|nr:DUF1059 domain-containing protein [Acidobacteriota bacterium]